MEVRIENEFRAGAKELRGLQIQSVFVGVRIKLRKFDCLPSKVNSRLYAKKDVFQNAMQNLVSR